MDRRGFLSCFVPALALDPERLLWQPGAKTISIPPIERVRFNGVDFAVGDTITIEGLYMVTLTGEYRCREYRVTSVASSQLGLQDLYPHREWA